MDGWVGGWGGGGQGGVLVCLSVCVLMRLCVSVSLWLCVFVFARVRLEKQCLPLPVLPHLAVGLLAGEAAPLQLGAAAAHSLQVPA